MFPIGRLLKEHEELLSASRELVDELNRSNTYAESEIGRMRARVAVLLKEHLTSEHEHLLSKRHDLSILLGRPLLSTDVGALCCCLVGLRDRVRYEQ